MTTNSPPQEVRVQDSFDFCLFENAHARNREDRSHGGVKSDGAETPHGDYVRIHQRQQDHGPPRRPGELYLFPWKSQEKNRRLHVDEGPRLTGLFGPRNEQTEIRTHDSLDFCKFEYDCRFKSDRREPHN